MTRPIETHGESVPSSAIEAATQSLAMEAATQAAERLAKALAVRKTERVVLAESCTVGMVAALLGQIPGISEFLCGSAVTYRESVKQQWIGVSAATLSEHSAESLATSDAMAIGVLNVSREATISAAVTGHLGPGVPLDLDGRIYVSLAVRDSESIKCCRSESFQLIASSRVDRQYESAGRVLELLLTQLSRLM